MIVKIEGILDSVTATGARLRLPNGMTYEVLLPAVSQAALAGDVGQTVSLHTLHYFESQNQGATMTPRLAGFLTETDRAFFELFTTCKGIGNRKALRAMALPVEQIAAAIADRDLALLQTLPEIGRRMAETVVATLHGKVDHFVTAAAFTSAAGGGKGDKDRGTSAGMAREALGVLMQLGENRAAAVNWIDQAMRDPDDRPADVQTLVERVYAIKAGS